MIPLDQISRRAFVGGAVATVAGTLPAARLVRGAPVTARDDEFQLATSPSRVFKRTSDFNREGVESWICTLRLTGATPAVELEGLVVELRQGGTTRSVTRYDREATRLLNLIPANYRMPEQPPYPLFGMRLRATHPQNFGIDLVRAELTVRDGTGAPVQVVKEIPIESYVQRTKLIFPFRGPGVVTQGGATNDGHRNRSGMFAIDALGLNELYGPMLSDSDASEAFAGWGRPIVAPAAGVVVVARGDRPDQPMSGVSDPRYFLPEFRDGGDPGNHVVIDHGGGEFSMIAHFRQGTLSVAVGERVEQGRQLGLMGSSGDSTSPHVHHQLQAGADWQSADALPHRYENGPRDRHDRGWYFNAE